MLPSAFPEVQGYPNLRRLLENQVDMQFADLRTLFRLPLPREGLEGGGNFAAATVLFNIIAGASVCFYDASEQGLTDRQDRGRRFKEVLKNFYPWQGEPLTKDGCLSVLYESARNPLAHSLGLDAPPKGATGRQIFLKKWSLTESEVQELEESSSRPDWALSTVLHLRLMESGSIELAISIPALYWGAHRMLRALFADPIHSAKAEQLAELFAPQWDIYIRVFDFGHGTDDVSVERHCGICGRELVLTDGGHTYKCSHCNT